MKKLAFLLLPLFIFAFFCVPTLGVKTAYAEDVKVNAKSALLYDAKSKTVIYSKDEHKRLPIASMTKLATLMMVFDEIDKGNITLDEKIRVSKTAAATEGSSAFLDEGSEYTVHDLIMSVIIASANDSAVALAERVAGSEVAFAKLMNKRANELSLENTHFVNATGLPAIDHYSSAYDISIIYTTICDNPVYRKLSKIWMIDLIHPSGRKTQLVNTNRLIKSYEGCDSGKTGYTSEAGYCLAASATRGGMRLVSVVIGASTSKERFNQVADMFTFGFDNFENKTVISKDKPITELLVSGSNEKTAKVYVKEDFIKFLKRGEDFKYSLKYDEMKIKAPVKAGEGIGKIYVLDENNIVIFETDLVTDKDVKAITFGEILHKIYERI